MQLYCPSIDANVHVSIIGYLIARRFFPRAREEIDYPSVRQWRRSAVPIHPLLRYVTWPTVRPFHGPRDCAITLPGRSQTHGETNERNTDSSRETGEGKRERERRPSNSTTDGREKLWRRDLHWNGTKREREIN